MKTREALWIWGGIFAPGFLLLLIIVMLILFPAALRQSADAPPAPPASAPSSKVIAREKVFYQVAREGGPTMPYLGIGLVLALALAIESLFRFRTARALQPDEAACLRHQIEQKQFTETAGFCDANPCMTTAAVGTALAEKDHSREAAYFRVRETMLACAGEMTRFLPYFLLLGLLEILLGILGTLLGMVMAFATLGTSGIANPAYLAAVLGEVLISSATACLFAIPAFILYFVFHARAEKLVSRVRLSVYDLIEKIPYA